jgi:hypothetical protein
MVKGREPAFQAPVPVQRSIHAPFTPMTAPFPMRSFLAGLALLGLVGDSRADLRITARPCFTQRQMQDAVAGNRVVRPTQAVSAARQTVPGGDLLRAMLCSDGEVYLYVISVLRKDGRVVHVIVDGPSGTVAAVQ